VSLVLGIDTATADSAVALARMFRTKSLRKQAPDSAQFCPDGKVSPDTQPARSVELI